MTPELIAFAKTVAEERGLTADQLTPAVCGDVLQEAVRRMAKLTQEVTDGRTDRAQEMVAVMARQIYWTCRLNRVGVAA